MAVLVTEFAAERKVVFRHRDGVFAAERRDWIILLHSATKPSGACLSASIPRLSIGTRVMEDSGAAIFATHLMEYEVAVGLTAMRVQGGDCRHQAFK